MGFGIERRSLRTKKIGLPSVFPFDGENELGRRSIYSSERCWWIGGEKKSVRFVPPNFRGRLFSRFQFGLVFTKDHVWCFIWVKNYGHMGYVSNANEDIPLLHEKFQMSYRRMERKNNWKLKERGRAENFFHQWLGRPCMHPRNSFLRFPNHSRHKLYTFDEDGLFRIVKNSDRSLDTNT